MAVLGQGARMCQINGHAKKSLILRQIFSRLYHQFFVQNRKYVDQKYKLAGSSHSIACITLVATFDERF